jgi:hypothetical protein
MNDFKELEFIPIIRSYEDSFHKTSNEVAKEIA